jgi:hypothetical protein
LEGKSKSDTPKRIKNFYTMHPKMERNGTELQTLGIKDEKDGWMCREYIR